MLNCLRSTDIASRDVRQGLERGNLVLRGSRLDAGPVRRGECEERLLYRRSKTCAVDPTGNPQQYLAELDRVLAKGGKGPRSDGLDCGLLLVSSSWDRGIGGRGSRTW